MYNNLEISSLENEEWKQLKFNLRFEYQVSSFGRVRILKKNYCCIKRQRIGNYKHPILSIRFSKQKIKRHLTHRLVAQAFIPNPENKRTVNHINGIKHDNRVQNLEWASDYEQAIHRHYILKKQTTIVASSYAKIKCSKAVGKYNSANKLLTIYQSIKDAAKSLNKGNSSISLCCNGIQKTAYGFIWKFIENDAHLSPKYIASIKSPIANLAKA
jgi:hypothetical protein